MDYQTAAVHSIISGLTRAVAIDVHFTFGYIFWSDVTEKNIKRFRIDEADTTTIVTGIGVCDGLAVDWRSSHLYWTDTTYDTISISDLDGNNQRTLISSGLDEPREIVLDLDSSLMFWTDSGTNTIERASLDGNKRVSIVTTILHLPSGIDLDKGNKRVFWVDEALGRVESVDYNGNNRKLLLQLSSLHPFGVTLIQPSLFFTVWNVPKEIYLLDVATKRLLYGYSITGREPMRIVAYDYARQPPASNPCAVNNGGCSHFCVAKASGYKCVCPWGFFVKQDNKTCKRKASNPCAVNNGGCSHFCVAKASGYKCVCPWGFFVKQDNKTCKRKALADPQMEAAVDRNTNKRNSGKRKQVMGLAAGLSVFILLTGLTIFCVRKGYLKRCSITNLRHITPTFEVTASIENNEPVCVGTKILPQTETANEPKQDLPNCSDKVQRNQLPTSFAKYITRAEDTFSSAGGELCAALDSDVSIIVDSDTIPVGIEQPIFFGVIYNETALLRDVPKTPDETLISPVIECGPHEIEFLKPVKIIVPHCLDLVEAKKEWITVYRCGQLPDNENGLLSWEKVPNEWEKSSQSKAWFTVKKDSIHIKTKTFSLWSIFACGGPKRKRATVFASKPDPQSDLIYLRFYVYNDNEDSKRRVELKDRERFPDSRPAREKPFRMYNDNKEITVKLTNLEEGWKTDKMPDTQIYIYEKVNGNGFRSKDACDFDVKPEEGRDVNGFSCIIKFQQEDHPQEYLIYLNPGFTPLKRQNIRKSSAEGCRSDAGSSGIGTRNGSSSSAAAELEDEDYDSDSQEGNTSPGSSSGQTLHCGHQFSSLGRDEEPVTERHCQCISPYVGFKWKKLLRKLSMSETAIKNLEENYKNYEVEEKCYQGLLTWMEKYGPQRATTKTLCDALSHVGCPEALEALWKEVTSPQSDCYTQKPGSGMQNSTPTDS
ncbi:uncharacterized protein LOC144628987 isoform X2 [Oculina patagonica]